VIETPLKFMAPGITTGLGLGIGRLVFRALNAAELAIACLLIALLVRQTPDRPRARLRPALDDRAVRIAAGEDMQASSLHFVYIALDGVKLIALPVIGAALAWRWIT
jgi:hypothetical protein